MLDLGEIRAHFKVGSGVSNELILDFIGDLGKILYLFDSEINYDKDFVDYGDVLEFQNPFRVYSASRYLQVRTGDLTSFQTCKIQRTHNIEYERTSRKPTDEGLDLKVKNGIFGDFFKRDPNFKLMSLSPSYTIEELCEKVSRLPYVEILDGAVFGKGSMDEGFREFSL